MIERGRAWAIVLATIIGMPLVGLAISALSPALRHAVSLAGATGIVASTTTLLAVALVTRVRGLTRVLGIELGNRLHRRLGVAAVGFVGVHVVAVVAHSPKGLGILNLFRVGLPIQFGILAALVMLVGAVALAPRAGIRRFATRVRLHGLLGVAVVALAIVHVILLGDLFESPIVAVLISVLAAIVLVALLRRWVWDPLRGRGAYRVSALRRESATTSTVVLVPAGPRREAPPEPGQFVWVRRRRAPALGTEHPFTVAASSRSGALELTIRAQGAFSTELHELRRGQTLWVDGPHGAFVPSSPVDTRPDRALVMVAGGIGITPIMSILRAHAATVDPRVHRLLLAEREGETLFAEEIRSLCGRLDLAVTRTGGRRLGPELVSSVLPDGRPARHDYFVCGPPVFVGPTLAALDQLGVPAGRITTERFG